MPEKQERELLKRLEAINNRQLNDCEKKCYELLVKLEKEISWDSLLKIKSDTFFHETENSHWENPHFQIDYSNI
jgi:hypothetical protein